MNAEKQATRSDALEWFGILAGPVAWLTQFLVNYAMVRWECIGHTKVGLHIMSAIFLAIAVTAGIVSTIYFVRTNEYSLESEALPARRHFMAGLGIFTASLYTLAIIAQAIPSFIIDPCDR